jgi:hypothetical protein
MLSSDMAENKQRRRTAASSPHTAPWKLRPAPDEYVRTTGPPYDQVVVVDQRELQLDIFARDRWPQLLSMRNMII